MMTGKAAGTAKGSPLRQRMIDQMRIANLAESTQIAYLFEIERLAKHYGTSPADLDGEQLRDWILKLIDRGLSPSSTNSTLAAFRFFYVETLGCPKRVAGLRNRKKPQALPRHMTEQEVEPHDLQPAARLSGDAAAGHAGCAGGRRRASTRSPPRPCTGCSAARACSTGSPRTAPTAAASPSGTPASCG